MLARLTIYLKGDEHEALVSLAGVERREAKEQAAWIIRQTLEKQGLLPSVQSAKPESGHARNRDR